MQDKAPQLGAALAYYTVFSLAPLILILLALVGLIFRHDPAGAWSKVTEQMGYFLDQSAVQVVQDIAHHAAALDLLFGPDPSIRRGVHAGLFGSVWLASEAK